MTMYEILCIANHFAEYVRDFVLANTRNKLTRNPLKESYQRSGSNVGVAGYEAGRCRSVVNILG
jgi:hypothetical protein